VENCSDFKFASFEIQSMFYFLSLLFLLSLPLMAQQEGSSGEPAAEVAVTPATDATPPPITEATPEQPAAATPTATPTATPAVEGTEQVSPESTPATGAEAENLPAAKAAPESSPATGEDIIPLPPEPGAAEMPIVSDSEVPTTPNLSGPAADSSFADPNAVIPTDSSLAPAAAGPSSQEIERKLKIRYQEVRIQVDKDPAVLSLLEQSKTAKSFEDERAALREYYRLLFKKMKKVDKELTSKCDIMERAYIARLAQTRVEPTIPLNPPPTPKPLSE
jgi:hypothetical protein